MSIMIDYSTQTYEEYLKSLPNLDEIYKSLEKEYEDNLVNGFKDKKYILDNFNSSVSWFSCKNIINIEQELRKEIEKYWFNFIITDIVDIEISSESDDYYSNSSHGILTFKVNGYVKREVYIDEKLMEMYSAEETKLKKIYDRKMAEAKEKELYLKLRLKYERKDKKNNGD